MALSHPTSSLNLRARRSYVRPPVPLHFPEEETVPETVEHRRRLNVLFDSVRREFAGRAIVASDQFLYWDATDPKKRLAPDLAIRVGNTVERLPSWMTWKLGAPQVGVEIVSDFDRAEGPFAAKLERYRRAGIVEVVRFDPEDAEQPLRLWDSFDGDLVERNLGGPEALHCDALSLYWCVKQDPELGGVLRLARDALGTNLVLTPEEAERAAKEAAIVERDAALAEKETALARIAELEAELRKR
jgi:hypothetical protein